MTLHALPAPSAGPSHADVILGALLTTPRVIDDIADIITGRDFPNARDETIFDAVMALHAASAPVNSVAVADQLTRTGDLASAGGHVRLANLAGSMAAPSSALWHAARLRDQSTLRRVADVGARMVTTANDPATEDPLDVVNAARTDLDALVVTDDADTPNEQAVYDAIAALEDPPGMPTPWPCITNVIAGLKPGCFYAIGARPASGKTLMGQRFVLDAAWRGKTGIMFSLEMTKTELYHRMLASAGRVDLGRIQHRTLSRDDHEKLAKAAGLIAGLGSRLVVDDRSDMSVAQIRAKVRSISRQREVGTVVIDYLGLVRPPTSAPRNDRRVQVDAISRELKTLAKDLGVPVVVLAQLNRGSVQGAERPPALHDLRESGQIEQDADVVMLLHRDRSSPEAASTLQVAVAKNRHGPTAQCELAFRGHYARLDDMTVPGWEDPR